MVLFIAYQSESEEEARACKQALVAQGCDERFVTLWDPDNPWDEPVIEIGKKIFSAQVLVVIKSSLFRRRSWVAAEKKFARRVGVPIVVLSPQTAVNVKLEELSRIAEKGKYMRLSDMAPFYPNDGSYVLRIYNELKAFQLHAADRSKGPLASMRRSLNGHKLAVSNITSNPRALFSRLGLFYIFIFPGAWYNFIVSPIVLMAEHFKLLPEIEVPSDFGSWEEQLPPFVGGNDPLFDDFGNWGRRFWWGPYYEEDGFYEEKIDGDTDIDAQSSKDDISEGKL